MCVYLRTKFLVSSIILRVLDGEGGGIILPPTSKRISKKPTQIRVNDHIFQQGHAANYDDFSIL